MAASGYDYEEIIKQIMEKDESSNQMANEINTLASTHVEILKKYYESKRELQSAKTKHFSLKFTLSNKKNPQKVIRQESVVLDKKLKQLQQEIEEIKIKQQTQSCMFSVGMEKLYQQYKGLPHEFNNENMDEKIKNIIKSREVCELNIQKTIQEMDALKNLKNVECVEDLSNLKVLTQAIAKESLAKYGNPEQLQRRLSNMYRNYQDLQKKIQNNKVKYGIE